jgi:hypothetical protein
MSDRAVTAGTLAKHTAAAGAATVEALLDGRQHLVQQKVLPGAHRRRIYVLIAAKPGKAIGKCDDYRRHDLLADQPVEPFRQVLAEAAPIRVGQPAACKSDKIHKQRQALPVLPGRNVHVDHPRRRIAQHIAAEDLALDGEA